MCVRASNKCVLHTADARCSRGPQTGGTSESHGHPLGNDAACAVDEAEEASESAEGRAPPRPPRAPRRRWARSTRHAAVGLARSSAVERLDGLADGRRVED
eukprot:CAMPEP_0115858676 /NCGR_PEP_ID=MMETSP0287-20121206/16221_1 /TAXON_ID=412157 /ORGANISM="Chrysochromulina rotalis, Strain UIO044" /LENGTH=100 /DNA_ID=CAMNT_0003312949 /DNA_START=901 /DNA_END=1200 /DNA_ORIENTATION=+